MNASPLSDPFPLLPSPLPSPNGRAFQLRFESLFLQGRALAFPCDGHGHVAMDALSERARHNYLYARGVVGREFATPRVVPTFDH